MGIISSRDVGTWTSGPALLAAWNMVAGRVAIS